MVLRKVPVEVKFFLWAAGVLALSLLVAGCGSSLGGGSNTGSVTLSWTAPEFYEDGVTPLTNLSGYRVYYGEESGFYDHYQTIVGNVTTVSIGNIRPGKKTYFVVTAIDLFGSESEYSREVSVTLPYLF